MLQVTERNVLEIENVPTVFQNQTGYYPLPIEEARNIRALLLASARPSIPVSETAPLCWRSQATPAPIWQESNWMPIAPKPPNVMALPPSTAARLSAECQRNPARSCILTRPTTASLGLTVTKGLSWCSWNTVIAG